MFRSPSEELVRSLLVPTLRLHVAGKRACVGCLTEESPRTGAPHEGRVVQTKRETLQHSPSAEETEQRRQYEQHDRHEEDDLRRFDGNSGNSAESEDGGNDGDHEKRESPAQHDSLLT